MQAAGNNSMHLLTQADCGSYDSMTDKAKLTRMLQEFCTLLWSLSLPQVCQESNSDPQNEDENMKTACFVWSSSTATCEYQAMSRCSVPLLMRSQGYLRGRTDDASARAPFGLHCKLRRVGRVDYERGVGKHRPRIRGGQVLGGVCRIGLRIKHPQHSMGYPAVLADGTCPRSERGRNLEALASLHCMPSWQSV